MQSKPSNLVTLDNKLAQASYSLTLSEQRLIFILLSKLRPSYFRKETKRETNDKVFLNKVITKEDLLVQGETVDSFTKYQLSTREYANFCKLALDDARHELRGACDNLFDRELIVREEDGSFRKFRWIHETTYDVKTDTVGLHWSPSILPYISNLERFFCSLRLDKILALSSTYSWKLFTVLSSKKGANNFLKEIIVDYEELLFVLAVPESCKEFKVFNSKILQRVVKEISEKGLLKELVARKVLEGRRVKAVGFSWKPQEEKKDA